MDTENDVDAEYPGYNVLLNVSVNNRVGMTLYSKAGFKAISQRMILNKEIIMINSNSSWHNPGEVPATNNVFILSKDDTVDMLEYDAELFKNIKGWMYFSDVCNAIRHCPVEAIKRPRKETIDRKTRAYTADDYKLFAAKTVVKKDPPHGSTAAAHGVGTISSWDERAVTLAGPGFSKDGRSNKFRVAYGTLMTDWQGEHNEFLGVIE